MTTTTTMTTTAATMTEPARVVPASPAPRLWAVMRRAAASIRVRIVVGYLLLMTIGLVIAVLVTRQVQLARVDREIEQEQAQEVEELRRLAEEGIDPATGEPFGEDVAAIFDTFLSRNVPSDDEGFYALVAGQPFQSSTGSPALFDDPQFPAAWQVSSPTTWTTETDLTWPAGLTAGERVGEVRSLAVPLMSGDRPGGVFVVASFPNDDQREVADVVRVITLASIAVLALTTAVAWSLAGRVLRPVRELTATARRITESDLSARIPVDGHDELAELSTTFNDMVERLDHGFTAQRQFLDDVAHELRTPITIARGHLEVLGDDPAERAETVDIVTDELDRMSRYVSDLLVIAKADQPDFLVIAPIDLGELALDLHQRLRGLADRTWVLDDAPPVGIVTIEADRARLEQAILNLATNAVQHTADGDEIGLAITAAGRAAHLAVRDTGPGVDPALAGTLFDRYSRAATSRTSRPDGTGIGLTIVDAIARAHGGHASVTSTAGVGATFTVTIPLATWAPPYAHAAHPEEEQTEP
jgi:signal transduction histidine kinase